MALTKHHDLINTDYFSNTFYVRELEKNIERKLTTIEKDITPSLITRLVGVEREPITSFSQPTNAKGINKHKNKNKNLNLFIVPLIIVFIIPKNIV